LEWWLRKDIEKFVFINKLSPSAFLWHKKVVIGHQPYITAGWFPASSKTSFLELSKAVVNHINAADAISPNAIWIASVHPRNKAAKQLNKRCGYAEIDEEMREIAQKILPNMPDTYIFMAMMPSKKMSANPPTIDKTNKN